MALKFSTLFRNSLLDVLHGIHFDRLTLYTGDMPDAGEDPTGVSVGYVDGIAWDSAADGKIILDGPITDGVGLDDIVGYGMLGDDSGDNYIYGSAGTGELANDFVTNLGTYGFMEEIQFLSGTATYPGE